MRITDPQVIQDGEQDLIASVQKDLDPETVKELLKERLASSRLSPKGGQIVVHNNDVAFRLDYEININGSLLFDRDGNLIEEESHEPEQDLQSEEGTEEIDDAAALGLDENLSIGLPDYDDALNEGAEDIPQDLESEDAPDDIQNAESEVETEDPQEDTDFDENESENIDAENEDEPINDLPQDDDPSLEELTSLALEDKDTEDDKDKETDEDMDDGDIDDILQENRDFWEQKEE